MFGNVVGVVGVVVVAGLLCAVLSWHPGFLVLAGLVAFGAICIGAGLSGGNGGNHRNRGGGGARR